MKKPLKGTEQRKRDADHETSLYLRELVTASYFLAASGPDNTEAFHRLCNAVKALSESFECCGGNDDGFPEHTMDCPDGKGGPP